MDDMHIYCCQRCGDIFESNKDERYCEPCRAFFNAKKAMAPPKMMDCTCQMCGKIFTGSIYNPPKFCAECKKERYRELQRTYNQRRTKTFICQMCGGEFESTATTASFCPDCRKVHKNQARQDWIKQDLELLKGVHSDNIEARLKAHAERCERTQATIADIVRLAAEKHMTYGEYVAKYGGRQT